ncbi:uncharacterized protein ColSpa_02419 [Colletotrichum spaethianum]|uniref:Uncharacterized protein n=1 Tax=Colletotrichum spaethianum TaxID=700344 RepID=A0AA37L5G0_9PEZI|nr:uncharacterized protein ColSpa_02419 [Colletotrichum spaethianum]GKT42238.1 hypothetical protein ColSpa_02419 [Colletotrichum spaethianum]
MLSGQFLTVLGLVGFVAASPQIQLPPSGAADCPRTMCIDGINTECSIRWGGCYDMCKPNMRPTMPPCKSTLTRHPHIGSSEAQFAGPGWERADHQATGSDEATFQFDSAAHIE